MDTLMGWQRRYRFNQIGIIITQKEPTMKLFHKISRTTYNQATKTPVIKCSICTGEQVAGFQDNATKAFEDIMLIQDASDLAHFREMYDIIGDIKKIY